MEATIHYPLFFLFSVLFAGSVAYCAIALHLHPMEILAAIFFPLDMAFYAGAIALLAWWQLRSQSGWKNGLSLCALLTFAGLVALRTLLRTTPWGYSIYYNGPAVLSFLILTRPLIPRLNRPSRYVWRGELLICLGCLTVAAVYSARLTADNSDRVPLVTERGTILVPAQVAQNYRVAVSLMKAESAAGRVVFSVPEDTSLYFLAGTESPSRYFYFFPGLLSPGKVTDGVVHEIDSKQVRYVLWSNRIYPDYGERPLEFGFDFDKSLGTYLTSHYHRVAPLVPSSDLDWQTRFTLWERNPESQ